MYIYTSTFLRAQLVGFKRILTCTWELFFVIRVLHNGLLLTKHYVPPSEGKSCNNIHIYIYMGETSPPFLHRLIQVNSTTMLSGVTSFGAVTGNTFSPWNATGVPLVPPGPSKQASEWIRKQEWSDWLASAHYVWVERPMHHVYPWKGRPLRFSQRRTPAISTLFI